MQYFITDQKSEFENLRELFQVSYGALLKDRCREVFEAAKNNFLFLTIIRDNDEIIAFCSHREMVCTDPTQPPSYMGDVSRSFANQVQNWRLLTTEWVTVNPTRLGKFSRVQPGDLILGTAARLLQETEFDAIIGFSRQDTRVDIMTTRFGTTLNGTVQRLGIDCSVVLLKKTEITAHPITRTQTKIMELWDGRTLDLSNPEFQNLIPTNIELETTPLHQNDERKQAA